ncbi:MAG: hypothetical protein CM1200mP9_10770 [Gammaproteobacteria bacterium]|nr:MAG: hypothetical protein CM1200mP9_10770 [Gammaproteobacteria bacterium]
MKTRWQTGLGGVLLALMASGSLAAEEGGLQGRPPWMQPQVVKASVAIKMTADKQAVFREAVGGFLDGLTTEYVSMMKQQKDDIPRRIKQARSRHARKMDRKMRAVLDDQQYDRYQTYRKLFWPLQSNGESARSTWSSRLTGPGIAKVLKPLAWFRCDEARCTVE